jgi:hypothetical protein
VAGTPVLVPLELPELLLVVVPVPLDEVALVVPPEDVVDVVPLEEVLEVPPLDEPVAADPCPPLSNGDDAPEHAVLATEPRAHSALEIPKVKYRMLT